MIFTDEDRGSPGSSQRSLAALAAFATIFSEPGFTFGEWRGGTENDGVITIPWFDLSPEALRFVQTIHQSGWVQEFDWPAWSQTPEAIALRDDPSALEEASPEQLSLLLTSLIRGDRFSAGTLAWAFDHGLLFRIAQRAAALLDTDT
jgi:hypothetical protein